MSFKMPLTRTETVAQELRREILSGVLPPGQPIKDAELADRLHVSVTPVREAVTQLISEGLIETLPNKRRQVTSLTIEEAIELMEVLGILTCAMFKRATRNLDDRSIQQLRDIVGMFVEGAHKRDSLGTYPALRGFNELIGEACGNQNLASLLHATQVRAYGFIRLTEDSPFWLMWAENLTAVLELADRGLYDEAHTRLEQHFDEILDRLRDTDSGVAIGPRAASS